jgi:hypothetical protein
MSALASNSRYPKLDSLLRILSFCSIHRMVPKVARGEEREESSNWQIKGHQQLTAEFGYGAFYSHRMAPNVVMGNKIL